MRFEQTFTVRRPPEDVFAFMVEPDNLARWQTVKTYRRRWRALEPRPVPKALGLRSEAFSPVADGAVVVQSRGSLPG